MAKKRKSSASEACARALARDIKRDYVEVMPRIEKRLGEFRAAWRDFSEEELFAELAFCLFTPQSKAKSCWAAVCRLVSDGGILCEDPSRISRSLDGVRFHNNKARYVVEARRLFTKDGKLSVRGTLAGIGGPREIREWLVANVKGMGYKEASHFLRNVGMGSELAILDRHILRNMVALDAMPELPKPLPPKRYLELERVFLSMAKGMGIPPDHLDMLLWYREAGEVFK
jgi:N-glycosylase/DNA lyase